MPLKIPVGRIGEWKHPQYGRIKMSQQTFDDIKRNFKEKTIGRDPFIRIGHAKSDDPNFGNAKAEGWITDIVQEGEFLFALADPTNPDIAEMVKTKQYRYASPEYRDNYQDKESGSFKGAVLEALALTNEPFLTQLPESRLLADPADTFYLDHEEVYTMKEEQVNQLLENQKQTNSMLSSFTAKLSEWFGGKKPENIDPAAAPAAATAAAGPAAAVAPEANEEMKKLSDQVAALQAENRKIAVDATIASYVAKGIPPAILEQYRPILLADSGEKVVKLSDGNMGSVTEQIYAALEAYPEAARVKLSQMGEQAIPPAAGSPEETKKLCDQDMEALGYKVDDQGRYVL
ncbi:phage protease [Paenibacillus elgii]